jgi:uncharacterized membrane protein YqjE
MAASSNEAESGRRGIGASLRGLVTNTLGLLSAHVQLFGVELQEEKERLVELAVLGACALVLFSMALLLVTLLVIAALWDNYRLQSIIGLILLYAGLGVAALATIRRKLDAHPNPFAATAAELDKDLNRLRS